MIQHRCSVSSQRRQSRVSSSGIKVKSAILPGTHAVRYTGLGKSKLMDKIFKLRLKTNSASKHQKKA